MNPALCNMQEIERLEGLTTRLWEDYNSLQDNLITSHLGQAAILHERHHECPGPKQQASWAEVLAAYSQQRCSKAPTTPLHTEMQLL